MEVNTKGIMKEEKSMEKVSLYGLIRHSMKVNLKMVLLMGMVQ